MTTDTNTTDSSDQTYNSLTTIADWVDAPPARDDHANEHPDDYYQVGHAGHDADVPARPRPCADPNVETTRLEAVAPEGTAAVAMDDATDPEGETFLLADAGDWVALDDMA